MKPKNRLSKVLVAKYLVIIMVPVVIIVSNLIYLSFNKTFQADTQQKIQSSLNIDDRIRQNNKLIDYYQGEGILDHNFYSSPAMNHLQDVKELLTSAKIILILCIIITLVMITIIAHANEYEIIFTSLIYGSSVCLVFMILLGVGLLSQFDSLFKGMHTVLFKSNSWTFPPDDTLIQVFPAEFFAAFANQLSLNVIFTSAALLILSIAGKLIFKKKSK